MLRVTHKALKAISLPTYKHVIMLIKEQPDQKITATLEMLNMPSIVLRSK